MNEKQIEKFIDSHEEIYDRCIQLNDIAKLIFEENQKKGFWLKDPSKRNKSEVLMLIVSELAEAQEALRDNDTIYSRFVSPSDAYKRADMNILADKNIELFKENFKSDIKDTFEDEIVDTIIRLFDLCGALEINISEHIPLKLAYNKTRPHKHGKKF
jgi:hypothetical protein